MRDSLASTPNANSCGQLWVARVLVYAIRSYSRCQFAGVYAKRQFLRTGLGGDAFSSTRYVHMHVANSLASTPNANSCGQVQSGTRSRLRDTLMCMCPIRWRLRQMPLLASMFSPLSRNAHVHFPNSLASTPNANFCYFLTLPIT